MVSVISGPDLIMFSDEFPPGDACKQVRTSMADCLFHSDDCDILNLEGESDFIAGRA